MDLILSIKAIQSIQSFSDEVQDECVIIGELLGVQVIITPENMELLRRLDEVATQASKEPSRQHHEEEPLIDYSLGNIDYSGGHHD